LPRPSSDQRRGPRAAFTEAGDFPDLAEAEQVRHNRLPATIFIGTVRVQAVPTAPGLQIDQRHREVIAAQEPREHTRSFGLPFEILVCAPCNETGGNRCRSLQRLLIERPWRLARLAKSFRSDRTKLAIR